MQKTKTITEHRTPHFGVMSIIDLFDKDECGSKIFYHLPMQQRDSIEAALNLTMELQLELAEINKFLRGEQKKIPKGDTGMIGIEALVCLEKTALNISIIKALLAHSHYILKLNIARLIKKLELDVTPVNVLQSAIMFNRKANNPVHTKKDLVFWNAPTHDAARKYVQMWGKICRADFYIKLER